MNFAEFCFLYYLFRLSNPKKELTFIHKVLCKVKNSPGCKVQWFQEKYMENNNEIFQKPLGSQ